MPLWDDVEIVTLAQAKAHARITSDAENPDLEDKLVDAHGAVLDYVADGKSEDYVTAMEAWDDESAPRVVRAAILRTFADMVRFRGNDDDSSEAKVDGNFALSPRARHLLRLYRSPALA